LSCDLLSQSVRIGDFQHARVAIEAGTLKVRQIGEVIEERAPGRRSDEEITVFDNSGISLQDLYVADALIREKARRSARGSAGTARARTAAWVQAMACPMHTAMRSVQRP